MIKKYKTIEESNDPTWMLDPDDSYYIRMQDFFVMIEKLSEVQVRKGIQRFKDPFKLTKSEKIFKA
ncbi:MAG: hypothetical protein AB1521_08245 [Bacteroidota bacterium]